MGLKICCTVAQGHLSQGLSLAVGAVAFLCFYCALAGRNYMQLAGMKIGGAIE
jgi:hypothetical protein